MGSGCIDWVGVGCTVLMYWSIDLGGGYGRGLPAA